MQVPWEKMPALLAEAGDATVKFFRELVYMAEHPLASLKDLDNALNKSASDNSLRAVEIDLLNYYTFGIVPGPVQSLLFPTPPGSSQPVIPTRTVSPPLTHSIYTARSAAPWVAPSSSPSVVFPQPLVPPAPASAQDTAQTSQSVQMPWFWRQQPLALGVAEPSSPPISDHDRVYNVRVVNPRDIHNGVAQSFTQQLMGVQTGPTGYDYSFGYPAPAGAW